MINFNFEDKFMGNSNASMINDALGTKYSNYRSCAVKLDDFGADGVIAWFVYMDGSLHGYGEDYQWTNRLSKDGMTIVETYRSNDMSKVLKKKEENGYFPYRLAFQLDPNQSGNRYYCKFVGVFCFAGFECSDFRSVKYTKVLDHFKLRDKGTIIGEPNTKYDLQKDNRYFKSIKEMGFSSLVRRMLVNGHVETVADLLELGIGISGPIAEEIRQKIYECFQ